RRSGSRAATTVLAIGALAVAIVVAQDPPKTVWDGVYTAEQAERGKALYMEKCVQCHGPELMGGGAGAGPLQGATFAGNWNGVPLRRMLVRVPHSMPAGNPATPIRQLCAGVLAVIFRSMPVPPGKTEC